MNMTNIEIEVMRENYVIVRGDSPRFGRGEILFEGNTFDECFDYVKRETGRDNLMVTGRLVDGLYADRNGRTFPTFMRVEQ